MGCSKRYRDGFKENNRYRQFAQKSKSERCRRRIDPVGNFRDSLWATVSSKWSATSLVEGEDILVHKGVQTTQVLP